MSAEEIKPTPTVEDYLQVIHRMERDGHRVIAARLAEVLDVSMPTVTLTLKRMLRDGWIEMNARKEVRLTIAGQQAAQTAVRRHMLAEWLLVRMLNIPWSEAHSEADQIEHTISERVETQMDSNLDYPATCPHGNPLPGFEETTRDWVALTGLDPGARIIIRRVHESIEEKPEALRYIERIGLLPETTAEVLEVQPINQIVRLRVGEEVCAVGWAIASQVFAEVIPEAG